MSIGFEDVIEVVAPEEPDYESAGKLGPDALPHLREIVDGSDAMLASKAAYIASLIEDDGAIAVLETAANNEDVTVRVAAAAGVANLRGRDATGVVEQLIEDSDNGVRRCALESMSEAAGAQLRSRLEVLQHEDPDESIRLAASKALDRASIPDSLDA